MRRRRLLATAAALGLAGCLGDSEPEAGTDTPAPTERSPSTPSATPTPTAAPTESPAPTASPTPTATPVHADYETTDVELATPEGETLATVTAAIADTPELRYLGLSDTAALPEDRGMLFVYGDVADRTFVMRRMDFGIDIVYADDEGVITEIHHAEAPGPDEDGNEQRYPGRGQYVLEVTYEFTTDHGVTEGDVLRFDL